jgi:hypothetical protein
MEPKLRPRLSREGKAERTSGGWRLTIPAGSKSSYRLAQLDDQVGLPRRAYRWTPPVSILLRARISEQNPPGTWGLGFWNDPFGFSCGPGDTLLRFPALPRAIWFFGSSPKNYLSFRDDLAAHGLVSQVFSSPDFSTSLIAAALLLPVARRASRKIMRGIVSEASAVVDVDPRDWHDYRVDWGMDKTTFWVDHHQLLRSTLSPSPPLGLVIWIDNQYAAFDPKGRIRWGLEASPRELWMEIASLDIDQGA